jgi:hypothetical protein
MHCDATELATHYLTFARVNTGPHPDTQIFNCIDSRSGASNGPSRSVECGEEAITGGINLATTITLELLAYGVVVMTEKLFPPTITDFRRKLGGADNIRE